MRERSPRRYPSLGSALGVALALGATVPGCLLTSPLDAVNRDEVAGERTPGECSDFFDNDGDGPIDCEDDGCCGVQFCRDVNPGCTGSGEEAGSLCANGEDDDGDGNADCVDDSCCTYADCVLSPECLVVIGEGETDCADLVDNDGNLAIDCADISCCRETYCAISSPVCGAEIIESGDLCLDSFDNDGDELVDCADPNCCELEYCAGSPECGAIVTSCPGLGAATELQFDDFEDGDPWLPAIDGRNGYWFALNDGSANGYQVPASGELAAPTLTPEGSYAIATEGSGFTSTAELVVSLLDSGQELACFYDLSAFSGVTFRARGTGAMRFAVQTAAVVPGYLGGACDDTSELCSNSHGIVLGLSPEWSDYVVYWTDLSQRDWGLDIVSRPVDVTQTSAFEFLAEDPSSFEFAIDDIMFFQ